MTFIQNFIFACTLLVLISSVIESRPQNAAPENTQDLENIESELDELPGSYFELPAQTIYSNMPVDRLQMLFSQYRPNAYLRSPTWNGVNELYRLPESKRQVRYRQCYFNPISCFKK